MKILHNCVIEHVEIKYILFKKLNSYCLAFTLLEILCIVMEEKNNQQSSQAINSTNNHNNQPGKIRPLSNRDTNIIKITRHIIIRY